MIDHHKASETNRNLFPAVCAECQEWNPVDDYHGTCGLNGQETKSFTTYCAHDRNLEQEVYLACCAYDKQAYELYSVLQHKRIFVYWG